jgi:hypothetical protein
MGSDYSSEMLSESNSGPAFDPSLRDSSQQFFRIFSRLGPFFQTAVTRESGGGLSFLCVHISLSTAKHLSNPWKFANARARRFQFTSELEPFFFQRKRTERSVQIFIKGEASGTSGQERGKLLHIQILL